LLVGTLRTALAAGRNGIFRMTKKFHVDFIAGPAGEEANERRAKRISRASGGFDRGDEDQIVEWFFGINLVALSKNEGRLP